MTPTLKKFFLLLAITFLSACNPATMIEQFADDAKEQIARNYIQRLIDGDVVALAAELDPSLQSGDVIAKLEQVRSFLPKEPPTTTNLIGYFVQSTSSSTQYNLTYQFGYGAKWVLANAAWRELPDGRRVIVGLTVQVLSQSLQETNAFSFKHARLKHYLFLLAVVAVPIFSVVTLVVCIRTKLPRRKWLWILFIIVGVLKLSLNWTTGQVGLTAAYLQFFGGGASAASIYSPWILSFSVPLGAILFWVKRNRLRREISSLPAMPPPLPDANSSVVS